MQQCESLALLPGYSSQFSQPHDLQNGLNEYGDGTHINSSVPVYQNSTTQHPFNPYTASNTTIQTHSSRTTAIDNNIYCSWDGCGQSHKTGAESRSVTFTHICLRSWFWQDSRKHLKTHTKPKQCPHSPTGCDWKGTAEERELQAHIKTNHESRSDPGFACGGCGGSFTFQKNLTRHQRDKNCHWKPSLKCITDVWVDVSLFQRPRKRLSDAEFSGLCAKVSNYGRNRVKRVYWLWNCINFLT